MEKRTVRAMAEENTGSGKTAIRKDGATQRTKSMTSNSHISPGNPLHRNDSAVCCESLTAEAWGHHDE